MIMARKRLSGTRYRKRQNGGRKKSRRKNIAKIKKKDPRTGRKTYYLGWRVKDTGKPGLDSVSECERIAKAIYRDYKAGRLNKREANGRFARLHNTVIPKVFKGREKVKAQKAVEKYWHKL